MSVRCKMRCGSVARCVDWSGKPYAKVDLYGVTGGSEENVEFYHETPAGHFEAQIISSAADAFEPGKEYYVDFTPAPGPA
jgi:activator of 2-hydroxyglutaryl-CoA dehydratase